MDIVQISNYINAVCQALPTVRFYHYGWYSDINTDIQNNFTGNNSLGRQYPAVYMTPPTGSTHLVNKQTTLSTRIVFAELQAYKNDGSADGRSVLEVQRDLHNIALNVLSEVDRISRTQGNPIGINPNIQLTYDSDAHNDRLCLVIADVTFQYITDCPVDVADLSSLTPPFDSVPATKNDYELL